MPGSPPSLAAGVAAFVVCEVGFRRTFGIARSQIRLAAAGAVLTTIPLGTEFGGLAQVGALTAIMAAALAAEGSVTQRSFRPGKPPDPPDTANKSGLRT
jgi:hypothetical protein